MNWKTFLCEILLRFESKNLKEIQVLELCVLTTFCHLILYHVITIHLKYLLPYSYKQESKNVGAFDQDIIRRATDNIHLDKLSFFLVQSKLVLIVAAH